MIKETVFEDPYRLLFPAKDKHAQGNEIEIKFCVEGPGVPVFTAGHETFTMASAVTKHRSSLRRALNSKWHGKKFEIIMSTDFSNIYNGPKTGMWILRSKQK